MRRGCAGTVERKQNKIRMVPAFSCGRHEPNLLPGRPGPRPAKVITVKEGHFLAGPVGLANVVAKSPAPAT